MGIVVMFGPQPGTFAWFGSSSPGESEFGGPPPLAISLAEVLAFLGFAMAIHLMLVTNQTLFLRRNP